MLKNEYWIIGTATALLLATTALADESASQTAQKAENSVKKGVRTAQDKTCELVNGKMQCLGKKIKHKAQNAADDVKAE